LIPDSWRTPKGEGAYHLHCYLKRFAVPEWLFFMRATTDLGERTIQKYEQLLWDLLKKRCGEKWDTDPFFPYVPYGDAAIKNRHGQDYSPSSISAIIQMWESERGFMTWCTNRPSVPVIFGDPSNSSLVGAKFSYFSPAWQMWLAAKHPDKSPRMIRTLVDKAKVASGQQEYPFDRENYLSPEPCSNSTLRTYESAWNGPEGFCTWLWMMEQESRIEQGWAKVETEPETVPDPLKKLAQENPELRAAVAGLIERTTKESPVLGAAVASLFEEIDEDPHAWDGSETKVTTAGELEELGALSQQTSVEVESGAAEMAILFGTDVAEPVPELVEALTITDPPTEEGPAQDKLQFNEGKNTIVNDIERKEVPIPELEEALTITTPPTEGGPDESVLGSHWRGRIAQEPSVVQKLSAQQMERPFMGGVLPDKPVAVQVTESSVALGLLPKFLDECIVNGWISAKDLMSDPDLKNVQGPSGNPYEGLHRRFAALLVVKAYRKALGL